MQETEQHVKSSVRLSSSLVSLFKEQADVETGFSLLDQFGHLHQDTEERKSSLTEGKSFSHQLALCQMVKKNIVIF